jgi:tetratricopeptide (TPR) repeat protein
MIEYDRFRADPVGTLAPIFLAADGAVDDARLCTTLASTTGIQASSGEPYRPRIVSESALPFPDLMIAFEAYVLQHCPAFPYERFFQGEGARDEFLGLLIAIDDEVPLPDGEAETDRLRVAERLSGGHPEVRSRLAERCLKEGKLTEAAAIAEEMAAANPEYGRGLHLLVKASRRMKAPVPVSHLGGGALFAAMGNAEAMLEIGEAWLRHGDLLKAAGVFAMAANLHPDHVRLRTAWARVLSKLGRTEQAQTEARAALLLDPDNKIALRLLQGSAARSVPPGGD